MPTDNARPPLWVRLGARKLESNRGLDVIGGARIAGDSADQLAVRIGDGSALLFDAAAVANPWHLVLAPPVLTLTIVLVFVTLLSIYAVRWITEPLSSVAAAAQSFGRSPDDSRIVSRGGQRELGQVADALHDTRARKSVG